jgi:hypothetical protein
MVTLEEMTDGNPIHPETIPLLHPKIRRFFSLNWPLIMVYTIINLATAASTFQALNEGYSPGWIRQGDRYENRISHLPIYELTFLGREAAILIHK